MGGKVVFGTPHQSPCHLYLKVANESSFCVFSGKTEGEIERNRENPSTARELERERSKRQKTRSWCGVEILEVKWRGKSK